MKIGDRVNVILDEGGRVIKSRIVHTDHEKSCGHAYVSNRVVRPGHILGLKYGFFSDSWIVGLDDGTIIKIRA